MNKKIQISILAGIVGTVVMTVIMMIAPMLGMPKMSPPEMLSIMMGVPVAVGWIMHFMIGISFAVIYTYLCILKLKIGNVYLRGAVFGILAFIAAQVMMGIMGAILPMPKMEGSMMLTMIGSLMGHILFGVAVAVTAGDGYCNSQDS